MALQRSPILSANLFPFLALLISLNSANRLDVGACYDQNRTTGSLLCVLDGEAAHPEGAKMCGCTFHVEVNNSHPNLPPVIPLMLHAYDNKCGYYLPEVTGKHGDDACSVCMDDPIHILYAESVNGYIVTVNRDISYSTKYYEKWFMLEIPYVYLPTIVRTITAKCGPIWGAKITDQCETVNASGLTIAGWVLAGILSIGLIASLLFIRFGRRKRTKTVLPPPNTSNVINSNQQQHVHGITSYASQIQPRYESLNAETGSDDRHYDYLRHSQFTGNDGYLEPISGRERGRVEADTKSYQDAKAGRRFTADKLPLYQ